MKKLLRKLQSVNECTCFYPGVLCDYCETVVVPLVPRCITPADTAQADRLAARAREARRRERATVAGVVHALTTPAAVAANRLRRDLARAKA